MKATFINILDNYQPKPINKVETCKKKIQSLDTEYNRKHIFARAKYIALTYDITWSEALEQSWAEAKKVIIPNRAEVERLKDVILNSHTPKMSSTQNLYESMLNAHNMGINLNTWKQ